MLLRVIFIIFGHHFDEYPASAPEAVDENGFQPQSAMRWRGTPRRPAHLDTRRTEWPGDPSNLAFRGEKTAPPALCIVAPAPTQPSASLTLRSDGEDFLTVQEIAKVLRLSPQTVRNWIARGTLPAVRIRRSLRIRTHLHSAQSHHTFRVEKPAIVSTSRP